MSSAKMLKVVANLGYLDGAKTSKIYSIYCYITQGEKAGMAFVFRNISYYFIFNSMLKWVAYIHGANTSVINKNVRSGH